MEARKLPVLATAAAIWRDVPRVVAAHPLLWTLCLFLNGAIHFLDLRFSELPSLISDAGSPSAGFLADAVRMALPALAVIPAALATHRTVIFGIVEAPGTLLSDRRRIVRYAALEGLVLAAMMGLTLIAVLAIRWGEAVPDDALATYLLIGLAVLVVVVMCVVLLRAAACFPAVAVQEGWAAVGEAWRALAGQIMRLAALVLISPVGAVTALVVAVLAMPAMNPDAGQIGDAGLRHVTLAFLVATAFGWVLTMSHVYKAVMAAPTAAALPR